MERRFSIPGAFAVIWLATNGMVISVPNTEVVSSECSGLDYPVQDYRHAVDIALSNVICCTDQRGYDYYTMGRHENAMAFAHSECHYHLTHLDCRVCVAEAARMVRGICGNSLRAYIRLVDCHLRFQERPFSSIP